MVNKRTFGRLGGVAAALAMLLSSQTLWAQSVIAGSGSSASNMVGVAIGAGDAGLGTSAGDFGTAVGGSNDNWGPDGKPLLGGTGKLNIAGMYGSSYGFAAQAKGRGDTALGAYANTGDSSPNGASDDTQNSYRTAVGYKSLASGEASVSVGSFNSATGSASVVLGYGSTDGGQAMVVSVGAPGATRMITNVTAGSVTSTSTDAVNGSQLFSVQQQAAQAVSDSQTAVLNAAQSTSVAQDAANRATTAINTSVAASNAAAAATANAIAAQSTANAASTAAAAAQTAVTNGQTTSAASITKETSRATAAEAGLNTGIQNETARATGAEAGLGASIANESTRAMGVESGLQDQTNANASAIVGETQARVNGDAATLASANSYADHSSAITLDKANAYTDQRFGQLQDSISSVRRDMYAGISSALAVAGLPQPTAPGKSMVSIAGSTYHGQTGFAAGYSMVSGSGNWVVKAAVTSNSRGDVGAVVGAGRQF